MPDFSKWTNEQIANYRKGMKAYHLRRSNARRRLNDHAAGSPSAPTDCVDAYADSLSALDEQIATLTKQRDDLIVRMQHVMRRFTTPPLEIPKANGQSTAVEDCQLCS